MRLTFALLLFSMTSAASDELTIVQRRVREVPTFRADTSMVLVPVTVLDRKGATVTGLAPEQFELTQDNKPQRIVSFGEEDVPVSVSIVFDTSGSMQGVLKRAKDTLRAFVEAANPEDEGSLVTVSARPGADPGFTSDMASLPERMLFKQAEGSTALVDSIYAAIQTSRSAHRGRKAILIISDGMDNHSRYSKAELMSAAVEADVQIYAVSIYDPPLTKKPIELREEQEGISFLEELARRTGGVSLVARGGEDVVRTAAIISRAMRDEYLIGYVPAGGNEANSWHPIAVTLRQAGAKAWARSGFYAR